MKVTGDWIKVEATQKVCHVLTQAGYQALFVGGCVRNSLFGAPVSDIDIATDARPETVIELATAARLKVIPTGMDHGTITLVADHIPHEVTTFREDVETFGRHAVVAFGTEISHDARRRDFTMNALYARPDGTVVDPLNGLGDLRARRVRFIEDPGQRIREDYLRILRFFRFHAWYGDAGQGLDDEGLAAVAGNLDGLQGLSRERIGAEIIKLLAAPDPAPSVAAMRSAGVLNRVLPGADDSVLGVLIHLEGEAGTSPDSIRRLAVLGGQDVAERLRLSRSQVRRLTQIKEGMENVMQAAELGYRYGVDLGRDIILSRAALFGRPFPTDMQPELDKGAAAKFPIKAQDLMQDYTGPALGARLKEVEQRWIDSDFALTRDQLL